jgi:hypothetical protein
MATLGTRKFWRPFSDAQGDAAASQILKNSGYISITLHSVCYNSNSNFWQRTFGGVDKIALSSSITYKASDRTIEAKSIQDQRTVRANQTHNLGLSRLVALKVPTTADGLELNINLTAVREDNFEAGLNLLNSDEFQLPLQLGPMSIGQILSITGVVKKVFSGIDTSGVLEATYAGIINRDQVTNPVQKESLVPGYLMMIASQGPNDTFLQNLDAAKLSIDGYDLKYDGRDVTNTYVTYIVTLDKLKGIDEHSLWNKKYIEAVGKLDELYQTFDDDSKQRVWEEALKLWIDGNALLSADETFLVSEKNKIKSLKMKQMRERWQEILEEGEQPWLRSLERLPMSEFDFVTADTLVEVQAETLEMANEYIRELGEEGLPLAL